MDESVLSHFITYLAVLCNRLKLKSLSLNRAHANLTADGDVGCGRVALVLCVTVLRVELVEFNHHLVTLNFRNYACRHNLRVLSVSFWFTADFA